MEKSKLDEHGREVPDPTPMAIPSGFKRPETLAEQVARLVRSTELAKVASERGFETFDESEDFDIEDDPVDPSTPFEPFFDPVLGHETTPHTVLTDRDRVSLATEAKVSAAKAAKASKLAAEGQGAAPATPIAGEPSPAPGDDPKPK